MGIVCAKCGKTVEGEGLSFCPYCGERLPEEKQQPSVRNEEAEKWIRKAQEKTSYPERKKILLKGKEACPDSPEIDWELLFIGEPGSRRGLSVDFSIIKCWVLEIYRKPGDFSGEQRNRMREQLFDAEPLKRCLAEFEDPKKKQQEYLLRLCQEYIHIFMEGNSQLMGNVFGFQISRNPEKRLASPAADMIRNMREDKELLPEQREQLWKAMYRAYADWAKGNTEYIDRALI